jgi:hypothetical protein
MAVQFGRKNWDSSMIKGGMDPGFLTNRDNLVIFYFKDKAIIFDFVFVLRCHAPSGGDPTRVPALIALRENILPMSFQGDPHGWEIPPRLRGHLRSLTPLRQGERRPVLDAQAPARRAALSSARVARRSRMEDRLPLAMHFPHLAHRATARLNDLCHRATQTSACRPTHTGKSLQEALWRVDRRQAARLWFARDTLFTQDEQAQGRPEASQLLARRLQWIAALRWDERMKLIRGVGEGPDGTLRRWQQTEATRFGAPDDPAFSEIFEAGYADSLDPRQRETLETAKARYRQLVGEITTLIEETHQFDRLAATSPAEGERIDGRALAEALRLSKTHLRHLGASREAPDAGAEAAAYEAAAQALETARGPLAQRAEAARRGLAAWFEGKLQGLREPPTQGDPRFAAEDAQAFTLRCEGALARGDLNALATIRRELEALYDLAEQAKEDPPRATAFVAREHSVVTVVGNAAAAAQGTPEASPVCAEAAKATETSRGFEGALNPPEHRQGQTADERNEGPRARI